MKGRYIPALTMLVAGLVASIICLIKKTQVVKSLSIVLVVLIIFLILGLVARKVISRTLTEKLEASDKENDAEISKEDTNENPEHENDTLES